MLLSSNNSLLKTPTFSFMASHKYPLRRSKLHECQLIATRRQTEICFSTSSIFFCTHATLAPLLLYSTSTYMCESLLFSTVPSSSMSLCYVRMWLLLLNFYLFNTHVFCCSRFRISLYTKCVIYFGTMQVMTSIYYTVVTVTVTRSWCPLIIAETETILINPLGNSNVHTKILLLEWM